MYEIERQEKIVEILREKKSCSVSELARLLCFSEATVRRDLNALDRAMKVRKTFGGAVIREHYSAEVPMDIRSRENAAVKDMLGRTAAELIEDHMTVFLDASTTVECVLPYISHRTGLTIVTNHPDIPSRLMGTDVAVYSTGGRFLHHSNAYVGEFARNMIRGINADLMLFSARGLSLDGKLTVSSTEEDIHRAMIENASRTCLLIDSSKVGKRFPFTFASLSEIDVVVTDTPLPSEIAHDHTMIAK